MRTRLVSLLTTLLVLSIGSAALGAELPPGGTFFDEDGNTHEGNIEAIAADGITLGCNPPQNTEYCPKDLVSRGQMAAFLRRALNLPFTNQDFFSDDDGSTFENDINAIAQAGITKGCNPPANTSYCPAGTVTRGQMAAFLVRGFGYTDTGGGDLFVDDDNSVFENDIDKLGTAGVTKGCNPPANDRYCPDESVLRDQMASFLARALELSSAPPTPRTDTSLGTPLNIITTAEAQGCTAFQLDPGDGVLDECDASTTLASGEQFWVDHGWRLEDWSTVPFDEREEFLSDLERFELSLNGLELKLFERFFIESDEGVKAFRFQFPGNLSATTHTLVAEWISNGVVETRVTLTLTITP